MRTDAVVLHETGFLSAHGPAGRHDLLLDEAGDGWMRLAPAVRAGEPQPVQDVRADLDEALRGLVAAAGGDGPFRVDLPCGNRILRPGRVPVAEILAAHGYAPVATLTAYVRHVGRAGGDAEEAAASLAARVADRPAAVAEVEPMEEEGVPSWCCALTLALPGLYRHERADDLARGALEGCGLEIIGRGELDVGPGQARPNAATVIRFAPLTVAA